MPGALEFTLAWLTLLASSALFASAWRLHSRPLALFGFAALAYFVAWTYLFVADDPSPMKAVQNAGAIIWLDINEKLHRAALLILEAGLGWPAAAATFVFFLGMILVWILQRSLSKQQRPGQATGRLNGIANAAIGLSGLLVGIGTASLVMIIVDRTGHGIDLARILAAALGESRLALLLVVTAASIGLGMVMPGIAAYLIAVALFGTALRTVGFDWLTTHLCLLAGCAIARVIKLMPSRRSAPFRLRPAA